MGIVIAGKCFCVCEDLRMLAAKFKGWTVEEVARYFRLLEAEKRQLEGI